MRDVRRRDHLAPGFHVKIVQPRDEATGVPTEGRIAELLSKQPFDERGIVVRLETGETGRVLRVWEGGLPPPPVESSSAFAEGECGGDKVEERASSGAAARAAPSNSGAGLLPTYDEPAPAPVHFRYRIDPDALERQAAEILGPLGPEDQDALMDRHEDGLSGPLLKRFGIKSAELEEKTRELLAGLTDEELDRKLGTG